MTRFQRVETSKEVFGETLEVNEELTQGRLVTNEEWSHSGNVNVQWLDEQGEIINDEELFEKLEMLYFEEMNK